MTEQEKSRAALSSDLESESEALRIYFKTKQVIAGEIRLLLHFFLELKVGPVAAGYRELLVNLAEDRFTVAVLGQFHRGKSSFINAVIGRELLPTGISPMTSACTILRFGSEEKLSIHRDGEFLPEEAPVGRLAEYVTENENPGNRKKVLSACLELPLPLLRRGLEFVDTLGFGFGREAGASSAYDSLLQSDAALFLMGLDGPLSPPETDFLNRIREHVHKVFFLVNKTDLLASSEREPAIEFVAVGLRRETGADDLRVFPVSAHLGLAAKMSKDENGYARSGFKKPIDALISFLTAEKSRAFLVPALDESMRLLNEGRLSLMGRKMEPAVFARLDWFRERILTLRARVPSGALPISAESRQRTAPVTGKKLPEPVAEGSESDLAADLRRRGCAACHHIAAALVDFFAHRQHALASDPSAPFAFAAHAGFCPLHTWQLLAISSPQGMSVGYSTFTDRVAEQLARLAETPQKAVEGISSLVATEGKCPACRTLRKVERRYIQRVADFLQGEPGQTAYRSSHGLCLRHLGLIVGVIPTEELKRFLLKQAAQRLEEAAEDMRIFSIKNAALRRSLQYRDEKDAYLRAVVHIAGERALCVPWPRDAEV
jgi:GTP-binding protein EngB required for normal cell division